MKTKKWYTSKTMILSIVTAVTGILMAISESVTDAGGDAGIILTVVGVMNGILRMVTNKPIA